MSISVAGVPNYCVRKFWQKLSISVIGVKNKLRRVSTVGSISSHKSAFQEWTIDAVNKSVDCKSLLRLGCRSSKS